MYSMGIDICRGESETSSPFPSFSCSTLCVARTVNFMQSLVPFSSMPFSSLFLGSATLVKLAVLSFLSITPITALIQPNITKYELQASFSGEPFTSNFNFITVSMLNEWYERG